MREHVELSHVQQYENECALASIAIATGIPYAEVRAAYPEFNGISVTMKEETLILDRLNVSYIRYVDDTLYHDRIYLIAVPSLNTLCGSHRIVAEYDLSF